MADLQSLIRAVDELSDNDLKQLYNHIIEARSESLAPSEEVRSTPRILGLFEHIGETWMSDDFNDELPDEFWLGRDES